MAPDIISINALLSALAGAGKLVGFHFFTHFPHPLNIPFCYMITYGALYEDIHHSHPEADTVESMNLYILQFLVTSIILTSSDQFLSTNVHE